jgi:predicted ATPase/DNA-binding SARP family transcriptional activator
MDIFQSNRRTFGRNRMPGVADPVSNRRSTAQAKNALRIRLLGAFQVTVGSRVLGAESWRRRKAAHLVKLLALAPGHAMHREQIMELLWPEVEPPAAANSLHQALHIARGVLRTGGTIPEHSLSLMDDMLRLHGQSSPWIDVDAYEAAGAAARRNREPAAYLSALALYSGDLLPDDRYEEWAIPRRESLRQERLQLLIDLAMIQEQRGEYAPAISTLQHAVRIDPAYEDGHTGLMRLFALSGQRREALRQFATLCQVLERELDVRPDPAIVRLHEEIRAGHFPPARRENVHAAEKAEKRVAPGAPAGETNRPLSSGNLPVGLTSFIGRRRQIAEIKGLLSSTRLLTLTGPGGCGKTRLALQAASELTPEYADGVWLVDLASITDPALVSQAAATAMSVQDRAGVSLEEALFEHTRARLLLIVLDNCEHLVDACARLAEGVLRAGIGTRILATSREPIHIPSEVTWPVPSLSLPSAAHDDPASSLSRREILRSEAVQLFIDRAAAVSPGFSLTEENASALTQICRRLDGIPLALELAAARVRVLTVGQLAERLDDSLGLLTEGSRTALTRQQTLKAALDWSHDLLSSEERHLFRQLAVFSGGCSVEAVEEVCWGAAGDASPVLSLLGRLVDKSLVHVEEQGGDKAVSTPGAHPPICKIPAFPIGGGDAGAEQAQRLVRGLRAKGRHGNRGRGAGLLVRATGIRA